MQEVFFSRIKTVDYANTCWKTVNSLPHCDVKQGNFFWPLLYTVVVFFLMSALVAVKVMLMLCRID